MKNRIMQLFETCPIIAAAKSPEHLEQCVASQSEVVFLLFGEVGTVEEMVDRVKSAGKLAIVHMDLINGLGSKESAADFIKRYTRADGIISTRPQTIKHAGSLGLFTILRLFMLDSMSLNNVSKQIGTACPDMVEVLPGLMPRIIRKICAETSVPIIAGGLISEKGEVVDALNAGALCVSTTKNELWSV